MHASKSRFNEAVPGVFFLSLSYPEEVTAFLQSKQYLQDEEQVERLEKPGEGNMNCVVRVITNRRSFILKQSRPWVEKYPQIAAPIERLAVEGAYYQAIEKSDLLRTMSPEMIWFDSENHLMALADLGAASDLSKIYQSGVEVTTRQIEDLSAYLNKLHATSIVTGFPDNLSMRRLNHEHIFEYPFLASNGLDLDQFTPGLNDAAEPILNNKRLIERIRGLGIQYLAVGNHLIHGDFYPGSWLEITQSIKVIDPEFGFVGPAEFDLGVMMAHLWMAQQPAHITSAIREKYPSWLDRDSTDIAAYAGIEILRRLLGVAQLPLDIDLSVKQDLLSRATRWIMGEDVPF